MQLHQLRPQSKKKVKKRVGRGGKRGTYSGRGIKGQKSRAGHKMKPIIRELVKRYPKLRGYRYKSKSKILPVATVNLSLLENKFNSGDIITPEILLERRIIRRIKGKIPQVKILGKGEIKKALTIEGCLLSKQTRDKMERAGGRILNF